ncbi:unnamed protein product [marine sediment metagenome]|uniref:Uncharacterized protein n=1 Tax=marine sediment metagenome TaxID=412755 RepID=X1S1R1_9ZZZZ
MVKAYNGQLYKLPWAGDIAGKMVGISANKAKEDTEGKKDEYPKPPAEPPSPPIADSDKRIGNRVEDYFKNARSGRITSSSFAIAWSFVFINILPLF